MTPPDTPDEQEYVAVVDQDDVTDEVRDIALKYDPLNQSGDEGFHVTPEGELHIEDRKVLGAHRLVEKKIPNDAIRIVPLPAETGQLVHQYGENGFRLYDLPAPERGEVVGLLGRNGVGKTTALDILAGAVTPNFGTAAGVDWAAAIGAVRGTALQDHFERLRDDDVTAAVKPQRVDAMADDDERVGEYLAGNSGDVGDLVDAFALQSLQDRSLADLSGGERQRVAIAATLATEADLYVLDEPSSFLDVEQRLRVARAVREHVQRSGAAALVVDHDLATLDLVADATHVIYGDPGGFGVVSGRLSARRAINEFLAGYLTEENVRIRPDAITFPPAGDGRRPHEDVVLAYPQLGVSLGDFLLGVDPGQFHAGEAIGVLGGNGLGKTTFARLLAGELAADEGTVTDRPAVSYKPQSLGPVSEATVRSRFAAVTNVDSTAFRTRIRDPFDLEGLFDRRVDGLSGGELQRVGIALCLARDAELYLLDEPSAFLDVERRASVATAIGRFSDRTDRPVLVVDHDLFVIDRVADRIVVFEGDPGRRGTATSPQSKRAGMNDFLAAVGVSFRRDERTGRPRVNKPGSTLDRRQKAAGEYYYSP